MSDVNKQLLDALKSVTLSEEDIELERSVSPEEYGKARNVISKADAMIIKELKGIEESCDHKNPELFTMIQEYGAAEHSQNDGLAIHLLSKIKEAIAAAEQAQQADDADAEWRRLALQFDGHRMQALAHLRCFLENPESHADAVRAFLASPPLSGEQVLNERIAAMYQSTDDWQPSGIEYDRSIHGNPDAGAWANFFVETFPALKGKEGLMLCWFANAMMAMHDYLQTQPPAVAVPGAVELLREMEWQHRPHDDHWHTPAGFYCPECLESQKVGHAAECKLAAVLAASQKP